MQRLSTHILSLLRLYDSVALPGLGLLHISYCPARLNETGTAFLPPRFNLEFEASADTKDKKLLDSYIRKHEVSRREARKIMEADLTNLSATLEIRGEATLPGVGKFKLADGTVTFHQECALNVKLPVIALHEEIQEEIEPALINKTVADSSIESHVEERRESELKREIVRERYIPEHYKYHNPDYFYIPVHKQMAKLAACLLLVVIVGLAAMLPVGTPNQSVCTASIAPISATAEEQKIDSVKLASAEAPAVVPDTVAVNTEAVVDTVVPAQRYYAVVAAFKTQKEVERFIADNAKRNFEVVKNGSFNLVTVASADTRETLESEMPLIRTEYKDSWIFFDKN